MSSVLPLPADPAAAAAALHEALSTLAAESGGPVPREAALAVFRRHLARIQTHVREAFEHGEVSGLPAARRLAALTDGLIAALHGYAVSMHARDGLRTAERGGHRRLRARRAGAVQRYRPAVPDRRRAAPGGAADGRVHAVFPLGSRPEGGPRHPLGGRLPDRGERRRHHPHLAARRPAGRRRRRAVRGFRQRASAPPAPRRARPTTSPPSRPSATARHRRYGDSPFVVEPNIKEGRGGLRDLQTLYWIARYVFGTRIMSELADPTGPAGGILTDDRGAAGAALLGFPVDAALSSSLRRRPRRGAADLRPAAGGRRAHGLHAARPPGRGRALHAPLLPDRARGDPADPCAGAGDAARRPRPAGAAPRKPTPQLFAAGFVLADGSCCRAKGREFSTNRCRCCASCRWRATAGWNCIRWPSAR